MKEKFGLEKIAFYISSAAISALFLYGFGVVSYRNSLFPIPQLEELYVQLEELLNDGPGLLESRRFDADELAIINDAPDKVEPGLLMVMGSVDGSRDTFIRIIDRDGNILHEWLPKWSEIWGEDEGDFPKGRRPESEAGAYLHGVDILPDASIVANFEHLSTVRLDYCGGVVWKLDNLGHHSVHYSDQGYLWVPSEKYLRRKKTGYTNHIGPVRSWLLQKISVDGEVLEEVPVFDVLLNNGLKGLLYLSNIDDFNTDVTGDTLHLNDIETFPSNYHSDQFDAGDLLISLRNINSIFVLDHETFEVKFMSIGHVLRQHDPDFLPNGDISVFDNNNVLPSAKQSEYVSRVVKIDTHTGHSRTVVGGSVGYGFFTAIMGVHQVLPNGNVLLVSSDEGRVYEFLPDGTLVWRYNNKISERRNGRVFMAKLLPSFMDKAFFTKALNSCKH